MNCHNGHFESPKLPIFRWAQDKLKIKWKPYVSITFGSGGVVRRNWQKFKMAAIWDVESKRMNGLPTGSLVQLALWFRKIHSVTDRWTDRQTQGDSNSSAGLRPVELKFTFVWLVTFVYSFMSLKVTWITKSFFTNITFAWVVTCVYSFMSMQVT